jgi:hypothetical protein
MARGNPNPNIEKLKQYQYPRIDENERDTKPVHVRIPQSQYEAWMRLPVEVRNKELREAIAKILQENHEAIAS